MALEKAWFLARFQESPYCSLRGVAAVMKGKRGAPLTPAALSLTINGMRQMSIDESYQLATLLGLNVREIQLRAQSAREAWIRAGRPGARQPKQKRMRRYPFAV